MSAINVSGLGTRTLFATLGGMSRIGYSRVSTADQDPALQVDALRTAGCEKIFTEKVSGTVRERPELSRVLEYLRPGDSLVVWRLDRLARSLSHLIDLVRDLDEREVGLVSISESIDTSTPGGRLVFHVFAALAQFERELIVERTEAGLAAARARGRVGGRPRALTDRRLKIAAEMYESKQYTVSAIAEALGVSRATIYRSLKQPISLS